MRPRTPGILWVPFALSVGTISWVLLIGSLGLLAVIVIAPAAEAVRDAEENRNRVQATLEYQEKKIALQQEFIAKAQTDVELMQRLAALKLGIEKKGQETLVLNQTKTAQRDGSVQRLLADSLPEVKPVAVDPLPWYLRPATFAPTRLMMLMIACGGLIFSFVLGVRFDRGPARG
jgi:hypothetical protein